jgi:hypothetical protein
LPQLLTIEPGSDEANAELGRFLRARGNALVKSGVTAAVLHPNLAALT